MKATQLRGPTPGQLIAHVLGDDCRHCEGTLVRGEYKDNDAALCDGCGTPQVQVW